MARKFIAPEPGTLQRAVQDAVTARYGDNNEAFFAAAAKRLKIRQDSASGAFYRFMRGQGLPATHAAVYGDLLKLDKKTAAELTPARRSAAAIVAGAENASARELAVRLRGVAALVDDLQRANLALEKRLDELEQAARRTGRKAA